MNERNPWIATYSGKKFHFLNPQPDEICINDIAHSLSLINRFTGHTLVGRTVAEHSIDAARLLRDWGCSRKEQLAGLMHDASEAYLQDISKPLKSVLPDYQALEKRVEEVIREKFNIIESTPDLEKADITLCVLEADEFMDDPQFGDWGFDVTPYLECDYVLIDRHPWPAYIKAMFLDEFEMLSR